MADRRVGSPEKSGMIPMVLIRLVAVVGDKAFRSEDFVLGLGLSCCHSDIMRCTLECDVGKGWRFVLEEDLAPRRTLLQAFFEPLS